MDLLTVAIGIGLAVSLLFSELFGLAAGGMVVPGYIALYLNKPLDVALTILAAVVTYGLVHTLSTVMIIYGRRRTVLMILVGYLIGTLLQSLPIGMIELLELATSAGPIPPSEIGVIGYIIPGLLAIWIDRQGMLETISVMLTAAVVVRLILIVAALEGMS
jgi:poly-gamma-glutamate biosynthesis protein PgsC/CapC